jgi:acyl-coenzyme A thioesterase PaaI-like protein
LERKIAKLILFGKEKTSPAAFGFALAFFILIFNLMKSLGWILIKARDSAFFLWLLNLAAARFVPFNKPHGFTITSILASGASISLPYKRQNLNHLKGIHACALATLCEYSTGLSLLSAINPAKYRIILKNIRMDYHYQARQGVFVNFEINPEFLEQEILKPLKQGQAIFQEFQVEVYDKEQNHICTGYIHWQIKNWEKVGLKK